MTAKDLADVVALMKNNRERLSAETGCGETGMIRRVAIDRRAGRPTPRFLQRSPC